MPASLAELGDLSPALQSLLAPYNGTAMLAASLMEVQRLRRHLFESCRIDPCDLALFDHFPTEDRLAIIRELHNLVHARMRERQDEHARRIAAQVPVEAVRRALISDETRRQLVDLGIWAHMTLGDGELAEQLVDHYFDLTTVERVRQFAANATVIVAAFRAEVTRRAEEQRATRARAGAGRMRSAVSPGLVTAYATLGLPYGSSRDNVAQAFRVLAKKHHPDLGGDEARMKEVNEAYTLICKTWR